MTNAIALHRQRQAERGLKRVEVSVPVTDAAIIRAAARELAANSKAADTLRTLLKAPGKPRFAEWIASGDEA